jgi:carbon-monoxide dehydrogenase large subunit
MHAAAPHERRAMSGGAFIGKAVERLEDCRFLRGQGCYIDDFSLPGMLHLAVLRSSFAHAKIRSIDASAALAMPGIAAIFSFEDIAAFAKPIPIRLNPLPEFQRFLQFPLARGKARYVGEPIAIAAAETAYLAEDALEKIAVDYEELTPVVDWPTANSPVLVHEGAHSNITVQYETGRGDAAWAFRNADYVRKETFRSHRHTALPMETRGLVAAWDERSRRMQVFGATKVVFGNRRILADMLQLPLASIELIELDVGGGFGVRGEFYPEDFLVPFAARKLGRPVKWIEDRREHLTATNHSREIDCDLEIACRRGGTILGLRGRIAADMGAYIRTNGGVVPVKAAAFLPGPYRIANFACEVTAYITNKTPVGTLRGPGRYEANFFRERLIDMAANDLGIDPLDFRRRNLVTVEEMPYELGALVPLEGSTSFDSGDFRIAFERALAEIGWEKKRPLQGREIDGWYHGLGVACFAESGGAGPRENARITLERNGGLSVFVGSSSLGQGIETAFAQVCGDAIGIPLEKIRVFHGSTSYLEEGFGTYHGRSAVMGGNAVHATARELIVQLHLFACEFLGRPNQELIWCDGVFQTADGDKLLDLTQIAAAAHERGKVIEACGSFASTKLTYSYGTHAAHVAVAPRSGAVKVIEYVAVEDVGRMINPLIVQGQAFGAVVQGLGATFLDELVYDAQGQLLNGSLAEYLVATAGDFPNVRCIALEAAPSPLNPLGFKGAGEGGIVPVAAAIGNAVSAALQHWGVQIRSTPITPPRLWHLIRAAQLQEQRG